MKHPAALLALAAALLASACERAQETEAPPAELPTPAGAPTLPEPGGARLPPQASDFPELQSRDCAEVAQFYADAIAAREFDRAALVWDDPVIDGVRLQALYASYNEPRIEPGEPVIEGAAGSLYCTVTGTLTDRADLAKPPEDGEFVLRRANDVPGATPDQLRWTLQSSTFVESMERSSRS